MIVSMGVEARGRAGRELEVAHRKVRGVIVGADQNLPGTCARVTRSIRFDGDSLPSALSVRSLEAAYARHHGLGTCTRLIISVPDAANSNTSGCSSNPPISITPSGSSFPMAPDAAAATRTSTSTIDVGIGVPS